MNASARTYGFMLIELLIAVAIAAILTTAVTQLVIASGRSYQIQQNLGSLQENARFALGTMQSEIEAAGYQQQPWDNSKTSWALDSQDGYSSKSDRVSVRRWSDINCYDNLNTALDTFGAPAFYLRESSFHISSSGNLAHSCKYGPDAGNLSSQIRNLGLVENAEAFQALYAEDSDSDDNADRWVTAGAWSSEADILAVKLALVLSTDDPVKHTANEPLQVLDTLYKPPKDGRLRKTFQTIIPLRGRQN
jgi:type II secretory pathway component PulJ